MTTPAERAFALFERGQLRDECLAQFRNGLRQLVNPETGNSFTEDEIARATQRGSRWWIEADADDLSVCQPMQARALWLADQMRPDRASDGFLFGLHGPMWGMSRLSASGGSGSVYAPAVPGTIFLGSTQIPDPSAHTARDIATGLRFQVLTTATTPSGGTASLTLVGIDTGVSTNLPAGSRLRWESPPLGAEPEATVASQFRGGLQQETAAEFQSRLQSRIRHKPASGNAAHFRSWARDTYNTIRDAFVYPCAMHAGSVVVCITTKRAGVVGPNALASTAADLALVRAYVTPPGSPVVPKRVLVVVTTFTGQTSDVLLRLSMPYGDGFGWTDRAPWPLSTANPCEVTNVTDIRHFTVTADAAPTAGTVPSLMRWYAPSSSFDKLSVASVTALGGYSYEVALTVAPTIPIGLGQQISPDVGRKAAIATAVQRYFDSLGPGEVVDLNADSRAERAQRFPSQREESPSAAGVGILTELQTELGGTMINGTVEYSLTAPGLPPDPVQGPRKLIVGKVGIYPL